MNKKYIVKNCPCFNEGHPDLRFSGECLDLTQAENDCCADCTVCLIKQVIEKCITKQDLYTTKLFAEQILQLFEIKEINNDR